MQGRVGRIIQLTATEEKERVSGWMDEWMDGWMDGWMSEGVNIFSIGDNTVSLIGLFNESVE